MLPPCPEPGRGFLFVRHGESADNAADRHSGGDADPPLSPRGRDQAGATARLLKQRLGDDAGRILILAAPLRRTRDTARIIARHLRIRPDDIVAAPGFLERRLGDWNGRTPTEIPRELVASEATPPGGEDRATFRLRVMEAAREAAALAGPHCLPLVITSRGVGRVLGWPDMPNAGLFWWPATFAATLPGGDPRWPSPGYVP
ncbi:MAG: histidine phosphatase family protein [Telmatospirillum sp.]|nr:histidine phosphatase family protein [Telmatospirillum sp.]